MRLLPVFALVFVLAGCGGAADDPAPVVEGPPTLEQAENGNFTLYVSNSNTNDAIMPAFLIWGFWLASSAWARGAAIALAGWTKFAALLLAPLWLSYPNGLRVPAKRFALAFGGATYLEVAVSVTLLIAAGVGGWTNGNVSISPKCDAFIRRMTSARFARWISGWVKGGRASKSSSA